MYILFDENFPDKIVEGISSLTTIASNLQIQITSVKLLNKAGTPDDKVLDLVGKDGILITYDKDFKTQQHLYPIIKSYNIGVFFVRQPKIKTYWVLVQLIVHHWQQVLLEAETTERPFIFEVTKNGVEKRSY
jgi:Domain of unknown function (DUF5615)